MKRAFVAATALIGTALFAYSINALGFAKIHEAFVRIGWGVIGHRLPFATAFSALVVEFAFYVLERRRHRVRADAVHVAAGCVRAVAISSARP
jgi:cytochrome b